MPRSIFQFPSPHIRNIYIFRLNIYTFCIVRHQRKKQIRHHRALLHSRCVHYGHRPCSALVLYYILLQGICIAKERARRFVAWRGPVRHGSALQTITLQKKTKIPYILCVNVFVTVIRIHTCVCVCK